MVVQDSVLQGKKPFAFGQWVLIGLSKRYNNDRELREDEIVSLFCLFYIRVQVQSYVLKTQSRKNINTYHCICFDFYLS